MIIVKPTGGLGNRMRVINSCIYLAKIKKIPLKIFWKKDEGMGAGFQDLFERIESTQLISTNFALLTFLAGKKISSAENSMKLWSLLSGRYQYYDDQSVQASRFDNKFWMNNASKYVFNTCFDFIQPGAGNNHYNLFQPIPGLWQKIMTLKESFEGAAIGVHIRRTDHSASWQNSFTDDFIEKMDSILDENPLTRFYLSTDDVATQTSLENRYGNKIIYLKSKVWNRNSKEGIQDALVDMYCLGATDRILGSYASTFSEVASYINKVPLEIISSNKTQMH